MSGFVHRIALRHQVKNFGMFIQMDGCGFFSHPLQVGQNNFGTQPLPMLVRPVLGDKFVV
jgi:hypothetical protein